MSLYKAKDEKRHYFKDGESLCGVFMYVGQHPGRHKDVPICAYCEKLYNKHLKQVKEDLKARRNKNETHNQR